MAQKVNWIPDAKGSWATDFWPDGYSMDMAVFAEQHPVREAELNFIQQNEWLKLRDHIRRLFTDGWTLLGAFSFPGNPDNSFLMNESWVNSSGQSVHVGNPLNVSNATKIQLAAPPAGAGTRTDFVYLEVYLVEVASPSSTDVGGTTDKTVYTWGGTGNGTLSDQTYWTAGATETARRIQLRWTVRVAQLATGAPITLTGIDAQAAAGSITSHAFALASGSTTLWVAGTGNLTSAQDMGVVDGFCFALPIAAVSRVGGTSTISSGAVTDLRAPVQLQPGIEVPPGNIYPAPTIDPQLVHMGPIHVIYAGSQLAGYTPPAQQGNATTVLSGHTAAYATRLVLPAGAQPIAFINASGSESAFTQSNSAVTRVGVFLTKHGAGQNITVELHSDGGTTPGGTIYASATIPASWLTSTGRVVSFPIPTIGLSPTTAVWIVVKKAGTGTDEVQLLANAATDANYNAAQATDGVTWTASGALPFQCAIFTGTGGDIVHVISQDQTEITLFEYDANDNPTHIGEYYTGSSTEYDCYRTIYYNTDGAIEDIQ